MLGLGDRGLEGTEIPLFRPQASLQFCPLALPQYWGVGKRRARPSSEG